MLSIFKKEGKQSYSQQGEDLVIEFLLDEMGISKPYYVDIGCNDPINLSNTYYFYKKGASGVCLDPNPVFENLYRRKRVRDTFINAGLTSKDSGIEKFYVMDWHEFSTFDKEQAELVAKNYKGKNNIREVLSLPIISIKDLQLKLKSEIDFLNLDVEGLDFEILSAWDFVNFPPKLICVEHKKFDGDKSVGDVKELLVQKGYRLRAFNSINAIFTK